MDTGDYFHYCGMKVVVNGSEVYGTSFENPEDYIS